MTESRDFLLALGRDALAPPREMLNWHHGMGGRRVSWRSDQLRCALWGPSPAELLVRREGHTTARVACTVIGAPIAFGTLDVESVQRRLLEEYLRLGLHALNDVDGSFCGVLLDELRGAVVVFTDRFGFRKAFVTDRPGTCYAASRAVVLGRGLNLPVDPVGAVCCTLVGHTLASRTLFAGCHALMPGTAIDLNQRIEEHYWRIADHLAERPRDRTATTVLTERFVEACGAIIRAQEKPALNLTGGFDTRAVLSAVLPTRRPMLAVTSGFAERATIDRVVAASGVDHQYFSLRADDDHVATSAFCLLTDGEWDAMGGGAALDYWQRVGAAAPSGCLHGGLGEVWRAYHYKFLWPTLTWVRRNPVSHLTNRLIMQRRHLLSLFRPELRRRAVEFVRDEVSVLWKSVSGCDDRCAAIDGFYLLERQRGLTRIASAADLWNAAYSPFGYSHFVNIALGYLGPQNRAESLHRAIIQATAPRLAALPIHGGGDAQPLMTGARNRSLAVATARHVGGRGLRASGLSGLGLRRTSLQLGRPHVDALAALEVFEPAAVSRLISAAPIGSGNVTAIAYLLAANPEVGVTPQNAPWHLSSPRPSELVTRQG